MLLQRSSNTQQNEHTCVTISINGKDSSTVSLLTSPRFYPASCTKELQKKYTVLNPCVAYIKTIENPSQSITSILVSASSSQCIDNLSNPRHHKNEGKLTYI
jgi:hypothetical protein